MAPKTDDWPEGLQVCPEALTGRRWLGIKQDPGYVELARRRIAGQTLPLALDWQLDQGVS